MNPKIKYILSEACKAAGSGMQQFLDDYCADAEKAAADRQRERDIKAALMGFIELKANDSTMFQLLQRYFHVESISEATIYIQNAKVTAQIKALRELLTKQGMGLNEFRQYSLNIKLEEKLRSNPKLLDMTAEKLKAYLDKQ